MFLDNDKKQRITTESQLRKIIPAYPKILDKRIQLELDRYCLEFISFSTLTIVAYGRQNLNMELLDTKSLTVINNTTISFSSDFFHGNKKAYASLYFLVPGIGHGLRVNGQLKYNIDQSKVVFDVKSTYIHCARAAARAELWDGFKRNHDAIDTPLTPDKFLLACPYLLLKTMNEAGHTELSPRGDKAGFVYLIDQTRLFIPERPGNKVAVSLRNILKNNKVELMLYIPGSDYIMHVDGHATISIEKQFLSATTVKTKQAKIGILIERCCFKITKSGEMKRTFKALDEYPVDPDRLTRFSKVLSAHINGPGFMSKAAAPIIQALVKKDMKNLY